MIKIIYISLLCLVLTGCGSYFNQPIEQLPARTGEVTPKSQKLKEFPLPTEPVVVGVYNFKDQTGQYKAVENGSTFSTAVSQGATTMLIKALEDSKWFTPIERENLNNLLQERSIIRSTRKDYREAGNENVPVLPPLLFAGVLLEGGIVSYDTNIITGGLGARYFGAGGSTEYRQDRLTIYLRATSTSNGKILKTVYVSKTILSQAVGASLFKFVNFQRLLEVETGYTKNEPVQLAMKDAIEKAVEALIIEGIDENLWSTLEGKDADDKLVKDYYEEKELEESTLLYNRRQRERDFRGAINFKGFTTILNADYAKKSLSYGVSVGYSRRVSDYFNIEANVNLQSFESDFSYKKEFIGVDLNLEYLVLPRDNITPYLYGGFGVLTDPASSQSRFGKLDPTFKLQGGGGLSVQVSDRWLIKGFAEVDLTFSDLVDGVEAGDYDDGYYNFGIGVSYLIQQKREELPVILDRLEN